jgi:hypothetical protein
MILKLEFEADLVSLVQDGDTGSTTAGVYPDIPAQLGGRGRDGCDSELIEAMFFGQFTNPLANFDNVCFLVDPNLPHFGSAMDAG